MIMANIERPIIDNTAVLYNEQHSPFDEQAARRQKILNTSSGEYNINGAAYYISPYRDDVNDSISPEIVRRTIRKNGRKAPPYWMKLSRVVFYHKISKGDCK
jgi:hypothetical protein